LDELIDHPLVTFKTMLLLKRSYEADWKTPLARLVLPAAMPLSSGNLARAIH
jgi:hypothetical protein